MFVKIRTIDGKQELVFDVSKTILIENLKKLIKDNWFIEIDKQSLFYHGKILDDDYCLYDYSIKINDVIQLLIKPTILEGRGEGHEKIESQDQKSEKGFIGENDIVEDIESSFYELGDKIDCIDRAYGAWFEAEILRIINVSNKINYRIKWEFLDDKNPFDVDEEDIRPRAHKILQFDEISSGKKVMINYNIDESNKKGFWYDFTVLKIINKRRKAIELIGTLHIGREQNVENVRVPLQDVIFEIEEAKLVQLRSLEDRVRFKWTGKKRGIAVMCSECNDDPNIDCGECGCSVCLGKHNANHLLLCDECNNGYHLECLNPPLHALPNDDYWYCPTCKHDENEIVKAGGRQQAKKKIKDTSASKKGDWGKGMQCVGRTQECTIVPPNHRGPVPGVEVGQSWLYRMGVSESGIHRPHVAGIHGREADCAYSIVLSGGYEDDTDNGDEFLYTGSGGRDLSGNKRTAEQSCDQKLTRMNKALALNCKAKLNDKVGANSDDWSSGIPVRVVRKYSTSLDNKFAPRNGYRYDGIYKVVKYFPERGKSGYIIWRYLLKRDDPTPAPWTKEGEKRISSLGLEMICPEGYQELQRNLTKRQRNEKELDMKKPRKRPCQVYELNPEILKTIDKDRMNKNTWEDCKSVLNNGKQAFMKKVADKFLCVCCHELVYHPVTTPCGHNICRNCLKRGFRAKVYTCPMCRHKLDKNLHRQVNELLSSVLLSLYPGYGTNR